MDLKKIFFLLFPEDDDFTVLKKKHKIGFNELCIK
jgi:hypothetical protein